LDGRRTANQKFAEGQEKKAAFQTILPFCYVVIRDEARQVDRAWGCSPHHENITEARRASSLTANMSIAIEHW